MRGWLAKLLGNEGERAAARYLRKQGFRILARSYRNRLGEIDLIAKDGEWLVFVEVKTRRSHDAGHPTEAITADKQRQLSRMALAFLKQRRLLEQRVRFDVIAVTWSPEDRKPVIEHYRHAFSPPGFGQMYG